MEYTNNDKSNEQSENTAQHKNKYFVVLVLVFVIIFYYIFLVLPPKEFDTERSIYIKEGESLRSISKTLKEQNVVRSRVLFESFVIFYGGEKRILPGDYSFSRKLTVFEVARAISGGERVLVPIKVTIPEGYNVKDMAEVFSTRLPKFNKENFLSLASEKEGYLFPDTYFFYSTDDERDVFLYMNNNFEKKTAAVFEEIQRQNKNSKEIMVMASIIEREAKGENDRAVISGILWKRIKIGMPLQVDAAPDTYNIKGLPSRPIASPGLSSINAALYPESSPYLYYIHDRSGQIYFAKTFAEHRQNIKKYLK